MVPRKTILLTALLMSLPLPALAQPGKKPAEDTRPAQGEKLYQEAMAAHNKGLEREALEKFKQAYDIYPTPNTLVAVARAEELTDQPLAAMRHYREALKNPLIHPKNATRAKDNIALLEKRLGRIEVKAPEGVMFVVDGQRFVTPLSAPIDVLPGTVAITGTLGNAT